MIEIVEINGKHVVQNHITRVAYPFDTLAEAKAKLKELSPSKPRQSTGKASAKKATSTKAKAKVKKPTTIKPKAK